MKQMTDVNGKQIKVGDRIEYQFNSVFACKATVVKHKRRIILKFDDGIEFFKSKFWYQPTDSKITRIIKKDE